MSVNWREICLDSLFKSTNWHFSLFCTGIFSFFFFSGRIKAVEEAAPSLNYYWVPILVSNSYISMISSLVFELTRGLWCHSRSLDVCDFLHIDAGSGILPHCPWFLQRVRHVCGHTVPLLLWVSLPSYRSPAELPSSSCFSNTHTTVESCCFFFLQCFWLMFSFVSFPHFTLFSKHSLYFMF